MRGFLGLLTGLLPSAERQAGVRDRLWKAMRAFRPLSRRWKGNRCVPPPAASDNFEGSSQLFRARETCHDAGNFVNFCKQNRVLKGTVGNARPRVPPTKARPTNTATTARRRLLFSGSRESA